MTDLQCKAVAAGFIHALSQSGETLVEWSNIEKDDAGAVAALIQRTLGLASTPSSTDLKTMSDYTQRNLQAEVQKLAASDPEVVSHPGSFAMMQQGQ